MDGCRLLFIVFGDWWVFGSVTCLGFVLICLPFRICSTLVVLGLLVFIWFIVLTCWWLVVCYLRVVILDYISGWCFCFCVCLFYVGLF